MEGHTFDIARVSRGTANFPEGGLDSAVDIFQRALEDKNKSDDASKQRKIRDKIRETADVEAKNRCKQELEAVKAANETSKPTVFKYEFGASNLQLVNLDGARGASRTKHSFMNTAIVAYSNHLPLILSPDDIWVLVAQGIAQYLGGRSEVAERYRTTFVDHEGKKTLTLVLPRDFANVPGSPQNKKAWPVVMNLFADKIKKNTKTDIADVMIGPFSTTGDIEQAVFAGSLMEAMKNYFTFKCMMDCGIPSITLLGTVEDYDAILHRIDKLINIFTDFGWWLNRIRSHVEKIRDSRAGNPNVDWWNRMILSTPFGSGGQTMLTGWLGDFVPFAMGWKENKGGETDLSDLSYSVSMTDVILEDGITGEKWDMKMVTGFLGTHQDPKTLAVRPVIGWMSFYDEDSTFGRKSAVA